VFAYNRSVNNFGGVTVTNVYNKTVIVDSNTTRVSFNGGSGGTTVQPTAQERAAGCPTPYKICSWARTEIWLQPGHTGVEPAFPSASSP